MQNLPDYLQPGRRNGGRRSNAQKRLTYVNRAQILMNDPNLSPRRFSYSPGQIYEIAGSSNDRPSENEDMTIENERLKTFQNRWSNPAIAPQDLARYGFFYTGTADAVQCAFCNGRLQDWRSSDDPLNEHLLHYPQCPFILGCNAERGRQGNNPTTFRSTNSYSNLQDQPQEYSYQTTLMIARSSSSRANRSVAENSTMTTKPAANEVRTTAFENVKNLMTGFTDVTGDKKIDWANTQKRQEPPSLKQSILAEMNILSGEPCSNHFVTYSARISSFASWPKQTAICSQMLADAGFYYTGEKDRTRCFYCGLTLINWEKGDIPWDMHDRYNTKCNFLLLCRNMSPESNESCSKMLSKVNDQPFMEMLETVDGKGGLEELNDKMPSWRGLDAVRFALDAGYDESIISKALIANSYEMFESACELVDRIDTLLLIDSKNSAAKNVEDNNQGRDNAACGEKHLLSHDKQHRDSKSCFICMDAETSVVFLPCAHLVCCPRCSLAMTQCPICRTAAQGRLRIYI